MFLSVTDKYSAEANYKGWDVQCGKKFARKLKDVLLRTGLTDPSLIPTTEHGMSPVLTARKSGHSLPASAPELPCSTLSITQYSRADWISFFWGFTPLILADLVVSLQIQ